MMAQCGIIIDLPSSSFSFPMGLMSLACQLHMTCHGFVSTTWQCVHNTLFPLGKLDRSFFCFRRPWHSLGLFRRSLIASTRFNLMNSFTSLFKTMTMVSTVAMSPRTLLCLPLGTQLLATLVFPLRSSIHCQALSYMDRQLSAPTYRSLHLQSLALHNGAVWVLWNGSCFDPRLDNAMPLCPWLGHHHINVRSYHSGIRISRIWYSTWGSHPWDFHRLPYSCFNSSGQYHTTGSWAGLIPHQFIVLY